MDGENKGGEGETKKEVYGREGGRREEKRQKQTKEKRKRKLR